MPESDDQKAGVKPEDFEKIGFHITQDGGLVPLDPKAQEWFSALIKDEIRRDAQRNPLSPVPKAKTLNPAIGPG
jgi:hypothetical protein